METLVVAVVLGVISAAAAVLAIWLAFGSGKAIWRAILVVGGASGAAFTLCALSGEAEVEWLVLMWVVVATITAMCMLVRFYGYQLVSAAGNQARSHDTQYSVTHLLALTAVVAAVVAVARLLAPMGTTALALAMFFGIALCLGVVALVAVWATLLSAVTQFKTLTLIVVAIVMAGLTYYGIEATDADPGAIWGSMVIIYTVALVGSLWLVRARGFRLVRIPSQEKKLTLSALKS